MSNMDTGGSNRVLRSEPDPGKAPGDVRNRCGDERVKGPFIKFFDLSMVRVDENAGWTPRQRRSHVAVYTFFCTNPLTQIDPVVRVVRRIRGLRAKLHLLGALFALKLSVMLAGLLCAFFRVRGMSLRPVGIWMSQSCNGTAVNRQQFKSLQNCREPNMPDHWQGTSELLAALSGAVLTGFVTVIAIAIQRLRK